MPTAPQNDAESLDSRYQKREAGKSKKTIAAVTALGLLLAAGAGAVYGINKNKNADSTQNANKKDHALTVGLVLEPTNLNIRETSGVALDQILRDNVYQGLVTLKPGTVNEYVPQLAASLPEVSSDGKTYTFKLRNGVKFHDGSEFDSEDVVDSLSTTLKKEKLGLQGVEVIADGKYTVTVKLSEPNSQLNWLLSGREGIVLNAGSANDLNSTANGTGPFKLAGWNQGDSVQLETNHDYWGQKPKIERATFKFMPDGRAAANAIKDGTLDVHTALLSNLRDEFTDSKDFKLTRADSTDVFTLAYNSAREPFNNPAVRKALNMAINTDEIIASQNGDGLKIGSPITQLEPGYRDLTKINDYNPEAAKKALEAAGLAGKTITITTPNFYDHAPLDILTSQLQAAGLDAKVELVEFSTWLDRVYSKRDYDISYIDHAEPHDFGNYANPKYYFGYDNSRVAELYKKSLATNNQADRDKILAEAAEIVATDAPAKWLYNYTPTLVISKRVSGFPKANTNSRINLEGVSVTE